MEYQILISKTAKKEIDAAYEYYNEKSSKVAFQFINEIYKYFLEIKRNPNQFHIIAKKYKVCIVKRYPFNIYYFIDKKNIVVVSVFHTSRKPKTKFK